MASRPDQPLPEDDQSTMTMETLAALLAEEERQSVSFRDTTLASEQEAAIDFYEARPFGDEEDGRSQVVRPDVAEVVDYMTISVLRTMVSGDRVVEFEAQTAGQEDAAQEATDTISDAFMRGQDGYKILHDWLQSGLIEKIGIVKTAVIEETKKIRNRYTVSELELAALAEVGVQPKQATDNGDGTFLIMVETEKKTKRFIDYTIPSEEFLFSARCRHEDDMGYKCHRSIKTSSELVQMGFDRELIDSLPGFDQDVNLDPRAVARDDGDYIIGESTPLPGMERHMLREEYVNLDYDGDGIAELVKVFRVHNVVLEVDEVDENPFVVFTPFPRAHRMVGNSLADKVMDLQHIGSVLLRQTLDGVYLTNNPRLWLPDECVTENTIDDLLTVRPGGIIRGKGAGGQPKPLAEPFDVQRGLGLLEFVTGERESRTGITRLNQGLDADALNKTATGTALMQAQGQQIEEFIARNFAEAVSRLFRKKLRLMIENGDPIAIRVEGAYKQVDPSGWSPDLQASIRVGLGSGRKDQRVANRLQFMELMQAGMGMGLVGPKQMYNAAAGLIRDMGLGNPHDFVIDPDTPEGQQAQQNAANRPNPQALKAQADTQIKQAQIQQKGQIEGAKLQQQAGKDQTQAQIAVRQQDMQANLAEKELAAKMFIAEHGADMAHDAHISAAAIKSSGDANISAMRPGGNLDQ